jgi:hypothetical protein
LWWAGGSFAAFFADFFAAFLGGIMSSFPSAGLQDFRQEFFAAGGALRFTNAVRGLEA